MENELLTEMLGARFTEEEAIALSDYCATFPVKVRVAAVIRLMVREGLLRRHLLKTKGKTATKQNKTSK